ncbi:outer membrane channel protein [bacterium BMS3Abin07]|nr:outer membrane channel protein [bacterium BMS3Abin07]GBE31806.1 outer membrane channel protein [bacterium BMS3Bbin05]
MLGIAVFFIAFCFIPYDSMAVTLREGLKIVTSSGRDVQISGEEEYMAAARVSIAGAALMPGIDVYANQTWLRYQPEAKFSPFGPVPMSEKDYLTYGFRLRQLIYDFGKTSSLVRSARLTLKSKKLNTERVRNLAAVKFITAYFNLLESRKLLNVAEQQVRRLGEHLSDTKAMYKEGLITKNNLLQAEVMLSDAKQKRIDAENFFQLRGSVINSMLRKPLNEPVDIQEVDRRPFTDSGLEEAWKLAEGQRPELREMETAIMAIEAELESIRVDFFPQIYLSGGYEYQENRYMVHENNWSISAGASLNLFSGGATKAKMRQKEARLITLKEKRGKLLDMIRLETKKAYLGLKAAMHKIKVTEKAIDQANENLRLQRLRYKEGVGTATDVTDAVTLLTLAGTNYWNSVYQSRKAEARLLYSVGEDLVAAYCN